MHQVNQTLEEILGRLSPLEASWRDTMADKAIVKISALPRKDTYDRDDIAALLAGDFDIGILCSRLFLALSKDNMELALREALGKGGIGVTRFKTDREAFLDTLCALELPERMAEVINFRPTWSDILVERLRSGRGSAISGQNRGRALEDLVEAVLMEVFGENGYQSRCAFTGARGNTGKCDFVIPNKTDARIIIEVKAYAATGSKMSDVIGDLDAIIGAKRRDSTLLLVTDGRTWRSRQSDLAKIIHRQNEGDIMRVYTSVMQRELLDDLRALKAELGI